MAFLFTYYSSLRSDGKRTWTICWATKNRRIIMGLFLLTHIRIMRVWTLTILNISACLGNSTVYFSSNFSKFKVIAVRTYLSNEVNRSDRARTERGSRCSINYQWLRYALRIIADDDRSCRSGRIIARGPVGVMNTCIRRVHLMLAAEYHIDLILTIVFPFGP